MKKIYLSIFVALSVQIAHATGQTGSTYKTYENIPIGNNTFTIDVDEETQLYNIRYPKEFNATYRLLHNTINNFDGAVNTKNCDTLDTRIRSGADGWRDYVRQDDVQMTITTNFYNKLPLQINDEDVKRYLSQNRGKTYNSLKIANPVSAIEPFEFNVDFSPMAMSSVIGDIEYLKNHFIMQSTFQPSQNDGKVYTSAMDLVCDVFNGTATMKMTRNAIINETETIELMNINEAQNLYNNISKISGYYKKSDKNYINRNIALVGYYAKDIMQVSNNNISVANIAFMLAKLIDQDSGMIKSGLQNELSTLIIQQVTNKINYQVTATLKYVDTNK
jgi:hypothetical protein